MNLHHKSGPVPQNRLTLEQCGDKFRLFGWIEMRHEDGIWRRTNFRKRHADESFLKGLKEKLELAAAGRERKIDSPARVIHSWLTDEQNKDAHAAVLKLPPGRSLVECVEHANKTLGDGAAVSCAVALAAWEADQKQRGIKKVTWATAVGKVRRFVTATKYQMLQDITAPGIRDFVFAPAPGSKTDPVFAPNTQINYANNIAIWLNFCVRRKLLKANPVDIDLEELRKRARSQTEPEILTPFQCQKLLDASVAMYDGKMAPYVILGLWSFIRPDEVKRLEPHNFIADGDKLTVDHRGEKTGSDWRHSVVPSNVAPIVLRCIKAGAVTELVKVDGQEKMNGGVFFSAQMLTRIRAEAGLLELVEPPIKRRGWKARIKEGSSEWCNDILRHTGMSYLFQKLRNQHIADGMNPNAATAAAIKEVTDQAGNSKRIAFLHYLRRVPADACVSFFKIKTKVKLPAIPVPAPLAEVTEQTQAVA